MLTMLPITGTWWMEFFAVLFTLIIVLVTWIHRSYSYWKKKGIYSPPHEFLFGNVKKNMFQKSSFADFTISVYNSIRSKGLIHGGFYFLMSPMYVPVHPDVVKAVMQNDFEHFVDRGVYFNKEDDPLSANIFALEGNQWRHLRSNLTPTFTTGKMKMMFDILAQCSEQLLIEMDKCSIKNETINFKDILSRFTIDVIGSCAFGIDCNSLKDPNTEFKTKSTLYFKIGIMEQLKGGLSFLSPKLMRKLKCKLVNPALAKFFMRIVRETVNYREENNIYRKDFMHLLLQLKNRGKLVDDGRISEGDAREGSISFNELAAQAFIFFLAGFETSSSTMTFCLYELAINRDIQEKLRQEVNHVLEKHDGKLTYAAIMEMHYMDKVVYETLRKYPPLPAIFRVCTKEYKVPGTDVIIEKGTKVWIPVMGLHHDEKYYPDPEKFDPERFSEHNKSQRHTYTYIPFGEGPRICIGLRFGMMQTKVGLTVLLKNYKFNVSPKMTLPLKIDMKSFVLSTEDGIFLDYVKIN